jgi:hypothetical protein
VVGGVFGGKAMGEWGDAKEHCSADVTPYECDSDGLSSAADARTSATVSTIGFIAGGVLLGAGVVLWVTSPSSRRSVGLAAFGAPGAMGVHFGGAL